MHTTITSHTGQVHTRITQATPTSTHRWTRSYKRCDAFEIWRTHHSSSIVDNGIRRANSSYACARSRTLRPELILSYSKKTILEQPSCVSDATEVPAYEGAPATIRKNNRDACETR